MVQRILQPLRKQNFFLFGPRGCGKSFWLKDLYGKRAFFIDLLNEDLLEKYLLRPQVLADELLALQKSDSQIEVIVIDEIQKVPRLLNVIHKLIEDKKLKFKFVMTGSSSRRLKQKGVNLLAGRALVYHMHPFCSFELKDRFELLRSLELGLLPQAFLSESTEVAREYLKSYTQTYVKTEIQEEQWVRKIEPFRRFLPVAAQMSGQIVNYSNIARDVGVDSSTVKSYFEILAETLLGFELPAYDKSIRRQQSKAPKFYFFDTGVTRALQRRLTAPLLPGTSEYGALFEQFLLCEIRKLGDFLKCDYELFYLRTKNDVEIDLLLDRPGEPLALIEIKSKNKVDDRDVRQITSLGADFKKAEMFVLSNDPVAKLINDVQCFHWQAGLRKIFKVGASPL